MEAPVKSGESGGTVEPVVSGEPRKPQEQSESKEPGQSG